MLRYCAWCNVFVGFVAGEGIQVHPQRCQIDTSTICPSCLERFESKLPPHLLLPTLPEK